MKSKRKMFSLLMAVLFVTSLGFISCSDDDSPADHDIFVGKYNGTISYSNGEDETGTTDGSVEVVKVGNNYNFIFSNGIPELTGVEFEEDSNGVLLNVGATEFQIIRVTANSLQIDYTENENDHWTANCTRN